MPVRLLSSSVLKWPEPPTVLEALRNWLRTVLPHHPEIIQVGYFGSYAKGNWGVGSDLDLLIIVESSGQPFERRSADFDLTHLPVPVDLFVYTREEWQKLSRQGRWSQIAQEIIWLYDPKG